MSVPEVDFESIVVGYLGDRGYVIEPAANAGDYIVTANGDRQLPRRPRLSLDNQVLSEYLAAMSEDYPDEPDPLLEALSLTEIHIEEELDTVDPDGHNHARALGVRRGPAGRAEWFAERDERPGAWAPPSGDLAWQADPPTRQARDLGVEGRGPDHA